MTICFVFKGGYMLKTKCKDFSVKRNILGEVIDCEFTETTENLPIELNFEELACIYRVVSDEVKE